MSAHIYTGPKYGMSDAIGHWLSDFDGDAIRVTGTGTVAHNTIIDTSGCVEAHRDAIQLQPTCSVMQRGQYAGAVLSNVKIINNHIRSNGQLQGIFCSDGWLEDLTIVGNVIQTNSFHRISLAGVSTGFFDDNYSTNGLPCPIHLYPLRWGGSPEGQNVWILSFSNPNYRYEPIEAMVSDYQPEFHHDYRQRALNPNDIYLENFDLDGARQFAREQAAPNDALVHARRLQAWGLDFGDRL